MRYFTKDMWAGWQADDAQFNADDFERRRAAYWRQFSKLRQRIGDRTYKFLRTARLHDATMRSLIVADVTSRGHRTRFPTIVQITLEPMDERLPIYLLRYTSVSRVSFDYPSDRPMFHLEHGGIDDWGYDEVTAAGRRALRHEAIFSSGATLLIEFVKLTCRTLPRQ